jgi:SAM-dependent methyltransferase
MPPVELQQLVCGPNSTHLFGEVGGWLVDFLDCEGMLEPGLDFLDVGCGCGRFARHVTHRSLGSYTGFDRHEGMISWCNREIAALHPGFRFDYFALKSAYEAWDGQAGSIDAESFVFPYPAAAFDAALLASVFTHMPWPEVRQYLAQLARVMRPGAKTLLSVFFAEGGAEVRDAGLNIFYEPGEFLANVSRFPFDVRRVAQPFVPGAAFQPPTDSSAATLSYNYDHNWYVLTRRA